VGREREDETIHSNPFFALVTLQVTRELMGKKKDVSWAGGKKEFRWSYRRSRFAWGTLMALLVRETFVDLVENPEEEKRRRRGELWRVKTLKRRGRGGNHGPGLLATCPIF